MQNITTFNIKEKYIYLPIFIVTDNRKLLEFDAILDTGAPMTEFSDKALQYAGFVDKIKNDVTLKDGLGYKLKNMTRLFFPIPKFVGTKLKTLESLFLILKNHGV